MVLQLVVLERSVLIAARGVLQHVVLQHVVCLLQHVVCCSTWCCSAF